MSDDGAPTSGNLPPLPRSSPALAPATLTALQAVIDCTRLLLVTSSAVALARWGLVPGNYALAAVVLVGVPGAASILRAVLRNDDKR